MADTLPAVPSFRLTPPSLLAEGGAESPFQPRFGLSYRAPQFFNQTSLVQLVAQDAFLPEALDVRRILAAAALDAGAIVAPSSPLSRLPLESVGGTTMLRVGSPQGAHFAIGGPTIAPAIAGLNLGVGGGLALSIGADGTAGIFANVIGAPIVGGMSIGPVFRLSTPEDAH